MTNAEVYIGDEDLIDQFIDEFNEFVIKNSKNATPLRELIEQFFKQERKPTLTEDERVILRNIKNDNYGKYIGRGDSSKVNTPALWTLYLRGDDESKAYSIGTMFNHLFQFIKERRRIRDKGVIK